MSRESILAASAVVRDQRGRVLLVKRGNEPSRGLWSIPGGRAKPGEKPAETAAREVREETGVDVRVGEALGHTTVETEGGSQYEIHCFTAELIGGELCAGDDAEEARWVPPAKLAGYPLTPGLEYYLSNL